MEIKDIEAKDLSEMKASFPACGFQASNLARGIEVIKGMKEDGSKVFLAFTSNMVASGLRGVFKEMCRQGFVDCIITAGGSIDHDLIRSEKDYLLGDFVMDDLALHEQGTNRIGNILVPNECYVYLEERMKDVFETLYSEHKTPSGPSIVAPSEIIREIGKRTKEDSFLHWCAKNDIPVFSPGITDSAIGMQAYFFKQKRKYFSIDVTKDMGKLAQIALDAERTGGIILGGGISKHHAIGVNLLRDGFDSAVYVTTSSPWDGSLSGARTNEGISWGKIKGSAKHVTIDCDATIAFPIMMAPFLG